MLAREQPAQILARLLHRTAEDDRIGPREVHVLEHAVRVIAHRSVALARRCPCGLDDHHLARLHVAQVHRVDQVESAGFRREHVADAAAGQLHLPEGERTEAVRIARHQDPVLGQKHQRKRAFQLQHRLAQRARRASARATAPPDAESLRYRSRPGRSSLRVPARGAARRRW